MATICSYAIDLVSTENLLLHKQRQDKALRSFLVSSILNDRVIANSPLISSFIKLNEEGKCYSNTNLMYLNHPSSK